YVSAKATKPYPLSVWSFTSQLLAFINTHIATKNESMLATLGTLPGKRYVPLDVFVRPAGMLTVMAHQCHALRVHGGVSQCTPPLDANSHLPLHNGVAADLSRTAWGRVYIYWICLANIGTLNILQHQYL
ncbi:hypothetical protein EDD16DRAFT_1475657, partial [Pisolithus croceorrhizus]